MLKIIIFDCDGVMFDSRFANREYYNHLLEYFGKPPMAEEELDFVHMNNVTASIAHIFRHYPGLDMQQVDNFRNSLDYNKFFQYMKMEDDLLEFLKTVKTRYDLAISTNRTNTMVPLLEAFHLNSFFGKVMTAENAKLPKPAPDALHEILEHYDFKVNEAIYIGDSIIDRQHTRACNMRLIAFKNPELEADYHVTSFMEILELPPFQ